MPDEKKSLLASASVFAAFTALLWLIKVIEIVSGISFAWLGLMPLHLKGLPGIVFAPLLHANVAHVAANSAPFFLLGTALLYYYKKDAWRILALIWLLTGVFVWLFARGDNYHIGASGVVYALASFHFVSGLLRKVPGLMAFSLLVIFLYGSMVWGVFPEFFPNENISWESHLMGIVSGVIAAYAFRSAEPQPKVYEWIEEDEPEDPDISGNSDTANPPYWQSNSTQTSGEVNVGTSEQHHEQSVKSEDVRNDAL